MTERGVTANMPLLGRGDSGFESRRSDQYDDNAGLVNRYNNSFPNCGGEFDSPIPHMKRLFIVHGWYGSPQEPMISWLGKVGAEAGFETTVLEMPNPAVPTIDAWVKYLEDNVYYVDQDTYFIGHSIGCQAILRYLEGNKGSRLGGAIFIAPWIQLMNLETQEEQDIARPWIDRPIDFASIRSMGGKFVAIFSDDDKFVPLEANKEAFVKALNPKVLIEHARGHFSEEDGVVDVPVVVEELKAWK